MPIFKQWNEGGAQWGIWQVDESAEELRARLSSDSCDDAVLEGLRAPSRKLEYLAVRVLLKELLGREYRIDHYPSGKPFLPDSPLYITISHTKGYVAVGLHPSKEVGIDIEYVAERVRKVTSRFVRPDELPGLQQQAPTVQLYELLLVWSAKESLFKVLNQQDVDFQEHLRIAPFTYCEAGGEFTAYEYRTKNGTVYGVHYLTHPDFVCTYLIV